MKRNIIFDQSGTPILLQNGAISWSPRRLLLNDPPFKWEMFVEDILPDGTPLGGHSTGWDVYASGRLSTPGCAVIKFDTPEEAKAYAEATYQLQGEDDG